ncbi:MAG: cell wall hydrolase [Lachnospiraceae bacterium]|nr:cell wall hydrolase [Lachnospiraceae bacterium]
MKIWKKPKWMFLLAVICLLSSTLVVYATTTQEKLEQAEQEKKDTKDKLESVEGDLDSLKETKTSLESQLNTLNQQLSTVGNNLKVLEDKIKSKNLEIEKTEKELGIARDTEQSQMQSMTERIKFMYESGDHAYMELLLSAEDFGQFLNYADYVEKVSAYDRSKLEEFQQLRMRMEEQEAKLQAEKNDLNTLKEQVEAEKHKVTGYVNSTASTINSYSGQISAAEQKALEYEAQLKAQEENITYLRKKLAEEKAMSQLAAQSSWRDISEVQFEEGDRYLLANIIFCEAGGEPNAGKLAVGAVVINRVLSAVFPDSVVGVVYQNKQFSPVASGRLALALAENRATESCYQAADAAMAGNTNVGNCLFFRTPIEGLTGISIGGHIFY